jgi:tRNA pseudouridine38-40 synthase
MCGLDDPIRVVATGRTDSSVHAEMQIVGFCLPVHREPHQVIAGINQHTPDDIVCLDAAPMPDDFNPRGWTKNKLYRYRILNRFSPCPFRHGVVWHLKGRRLDIPAIASALPALVGQHDFTSFRAARCSAPSAVRTINDARVRELEKGEIQIEFEGHGFLRHQVRIMVGTLIDVGRGRIPPTRVAEILDAQDRALAGRTAPAHGLTLVSVELYDGPRKD